MAVQANAAPQDESCEERDRGASAGLLYLRPVGADEVHYSTSVALAISLPLLYFTKSDPAEVQQM